MVATASWMAAKAKASNAAHAIVVTKGCCPMLRQYTWRQQKNMAADCFGLERLSEHFLCQNSWQIFFETSNYLPVIEHG